MGVEIEKLPHRLLLVLLTFYRARYTHIPYPQCSVRSTPPDVRLIFLTDVGFEAIHAAEFSITQLRNSYRRPRL